jgi:predicted enzyme related to lactoylglutathione lyase
MLGDFFANTVLPAQDGQRAKAFYRDVLGLKLLPSPIEDPMMFEAGAGTALVITEMPERTPPAYATVSFLVTGIEELVRELKARGVIFEEPGTSTFQGQTGMVSNNITDYGAVKSAWFKDTEGNLLALDQVVF